MAEVATTALALSGSCNEHFWHQAVMWYGVGMLPRLRELSWEKRQQVMLEASEHSYREPLHFCQQAQFIVPSWGDKKLSGGQVCALMVFGLWVQMGEREEMCSGLVHDWPEIRMACNLTGRIEPTENGPE